MTMYMLLSKKQELLAKGMLAGGSPESVMELKITEGDPEDLIQEEILCLIGSNAGEKPLQCQILQHRGDRVRVKKMMTLNPELRMSYRIPVSFQSFIYPVDGKWKGRKTVQTIDMSCGGVSFYGSEGLEQNEIAEMVIPNSLDPVLVHVQIICREQLSDGRVYYRGKFVDMCVEQEQTVCQSVFGVQVRRIKKGTAVNYTI